MIPGTVTRDPLEFVCWPVLRLHELMKHKARRLVSWRLVSWSKDGEAGTKTLSN